MTGYLVMAVREARRSRMELQRGELWAAVDGLCWAHKFMGYAEGAIYTEYRQRSISRAWAAIDAVRAELARACKLQLIAATPGRRLSVG